MNFHGHECGGLALGVRAAMEVMTRWNVHPAQDEDIVCITENDACGVDGVQALLGCTLGKGNLVYHGTGKMAFNFYNRKTGERFRLMAKPKKEGLRGEDYRKFVLDGPLEETFKVCETKIPMPEKARSMETIICKICGEGAPENKIRIQGGKTVCLDCLEEYNRGW